MSFAPYLRWIEIHDRLERIFPEGTPYRNNCVWEIAAKTVFVLLYVDAIEGRDVWLRPDQVTRMTESQSMRITDAEREEWRNASTSSQSDVLGRWYAVNTRESIRDDTLRMGLIPNGAVIERKGLPTTSPVGRYALHHEFAALLDPQLDGPTLSGAIEQWQKKHLSPAALARITLLRKGVTRGDRVLVRLPNGETRSMSPGPSSVLSKAVIEEFAPRFLGDPALIWLSESGNIVVERDDALAKSLGLAIAPDKNLPDVILADVAEAQARLVFVEVVATDGPVTDIRKAALVEISEDAGFSVDRTSFVTAFADRSEGAFKKAVDSLAWGSYAWFMSEPDGLLELTDTPKRL